MNLTPAQREWLQRPTLPTPCLRPVDGEKIWHFRDTYDVSLPPPFWPLRIWFPGERPPSYDEPCGFAGWAYDGASVPWAATLFMPSWSLGYLPPAPHDAAYEVVGNFIPPRAPPVRPWITDTGGYPITLGVTRREVDSWFHLFLHRQRVTPWRCDAAYSAVSAWWDFSETVGLSEKW